MENGKIRLNKQTPSNSTIHEDSKSYIGSYYLADAPEYYEPQRSNTFTFYASGLDGILSEEAGFDTVPTEKSEEQALELSVKASSVPHFGIEPL